MDDDFDVMQYVEGSEVYTKDNPAKEALRLDDEDTEAYIPNDVLDGTRDWNFDWNKEDPRNAEGVFVLREK